jgi:hypothetical protein
VVTADALQAHPEAAEFLVGVKQAHYLLVVKANQPRLLDRCARLPWHRVPVADRTRGHGRVELRSLKAVNVRHFGFPHAARVIQVTRSSHTDPWPPRESASDEPNITTQRPSPGLPPRVLAAVACATGRRCAHVVGRACE